MQLSHLGAYGRLQRVQQTAQCAATAGTPFSRVARYVAWFAYIPGVADSIESPFLFHLVLLYITAGWIMLRSLVAVDASPRRFVGACEWIDQIIVTVREKERLHGI